MDYKNVQIPGSQIYTDAAGNTQFTGTLTNAGKARINGFEFEGLARLTDQFSLSGMYSYLDAKYKEWMVLNPASSSLVNIASANEFQNTPKHMANLTATYEWAATMFDRAGTMALSNSLSYKDKTYQFERARVTGYPGLDTAAAAATLAQNIALVQEAYSLWNASLLWSSKDRKIEAGLHGRNLTDKRYKIAGYAFGTPASGNSLTTFYGDPRTVTATIKLRF
jgi:iron complex outermembrane receptor protein